MSLARGDYSSHACTTVWRSRSAVVEEVNVLRSIPYGPLTFAILGQCLLYFLAGVLGAWAVPCCDDPTPRIPIWYGLVLTPIHFLVMLLPAFLCGLYIQARPISVGTLAAGVGNFLWYWLGAYVLATLFPARAVGMIGDLQTALSTLVAPQWLAGMLVSAVCYAAAGAAAASGGYLLRGHSLPALGPRDRSRVPT